MNDFERLVTEDLQTPHDLMILNARINSLEETRGLQERGDYKVCYEGADLVKSAIEELGLDAVAKASHLMANAQYVFIQCLRGWRLSSDLDNDIIGLVSMRKQQYFSYLQDSLAEAYIADTSKTHLRQYVEHKFGTDLGL
ncbi:hypothetical protein O162_20120 [Pseudomonas putida SJ3]|nr:hypothetical protein O162_20120 [Pseudomonas putida SJ3]